MNKFLFITHLTPKAKRSDFRKSLIEIYFHALNNQTYSEWKVLILGDEEKTEGKFHHFFLTDSDRETKFAEIRKLFQQTEIVKLINEADYIIKLDDDDIISPNLLDSLKNFDGDIFYDQYHTFLDSSSGSITQQKREWIASSCVHKKKYAFSPWTGEGASSVGNLLYSDHSKSWHRFYSGKRKKIADSNLPVYLRVLSPTSLTAHQAGQISGMGSMQKYYEYLHSFGNWEKASTQIFDEYLPLIHQAWKSFSGKEWQSIPKPGIIERALRRVGFRTQK